MLTPSFYVISYAKTKPFNDLLSVYTRSYTADMFYKEIVHKVEIFSNFFFFLFFIGM